MVGKIKSYYSFLFQHPALTAVTLLVVVVFLSAPFLMVYRTLKSAADKTPLGKALPAK